ncbi:MAG: hypothetical protein NVS3B20_16620 [Polyangiales bacterium]
MPHATVIETTGVGGSLQRVRLDVEAHVAATHQLHAQYIELRAPDDPQSKG